MVTVKYDTNKFKMQQNVSELEFDLATILERKKGFQIHD